MLCGGCQGGGDESAAKAPPTAAEVKAQTQEQEAKIKNDPNIPPRVKEQILARMQGGRQAGQQSGAGIAQTVKAQTGGAPK